ncbi:DUF1648 domain-containing protein [Amycolatopsis taiwanensis]|uniref:DUF1648 domain-containing protein n=1 Tax=Amycolatopsis taiwanensis TaxID=342230 RepID=UPI0004B55276|nr:DUF5808 domain-containing protein [Amycolatopsis taiwanensis]
MITYLLTGPLLLVVLAWLMPSLSKPTLPFGVRVPARHAGDPVIVEQRRAYRWWVGGAGGSLVVAGGVLTLLFNNPLAGVLVVIAVFAVIVPSFAHARSTIRAVKQHEHWYSGLRQTVAVDTSLRTRPEPFPWLWALPAIALLVTTVVVGVVRYPTMPETLALHYNALGQPDRVVAKSITSAFGLVIVQAILTAGILLLAFLSSRFRADLDPANPAASARQHRGFVRGMAKATLILVACLNLSLLFTAWQIWSAAHSFSAAPVLVPVLVGLVVVLGFAIRTGQQGSRLPVTEDEHTDAVERDDDRYWRGLGQFYVNSDDPAIFVPKRFGVGWTINMANPRSIVVFVAIVATAVAVPLLLR